MPADTPPIAIRRFACSDLAYVLAIQSQVYPAFLVESAASFSSRLDTTMPYCLAATMDGQLVGYTLAHGWQRHAPPPLGTPLHAIESADILFIHDLAVGTSGRGLGIGRRLVERAFDLALHDGLRSAELVAVEGAADFWQAMGFTALNATPEITAKLAGYGRGAMWMGRAFG